MKNLFNLVQPIEWVIIIMYIGIIFGYTIMANNTVYLNNHYYFKPNKSEGIRPTIEVNG